MLSELGRAIYPSGFLRAQHTSGHLGVPNPVARLWDCEYLRD
jgi:hypothetical protein